MAQGSKKGAAKVTRITASEKAESAAEPTVAKSTTKGSKKPIKPEKETSGNPFVRLGNYFKGAWAELRQVRWPDRKNTWAMTGALIAFTAFFIVIILVLDYLFSQLFKLILGSN